MTFNIIEGIEIDFNGIRNNYLYVSPKKGCEDYLKPFNSYKVLSVDTDGDFLIIDESGITLICCKEDCAHSPNGYNFINCN